MGSLIIPSVFRQQPQQRAPVDTGNPICRGLVFAATPFGESVAGSNGILYGTTAATTGPLGRSFSNTTATSGAEFLAAPDLYGIGTDITVVVLASVTAYGAYNHLLTVPYNTSTWADPFGAMGLQASGDANALRFWGKDIDYVGTSATRILNDGLPHMYAAARSLAGVTFMRDAVVEISTGGTLNAANGAFNWNTRNPVNLLGRNRMAPGESPTGKVYLALIWNRRLSNAELSSVQANPWQLFKAPTRRILVAAPALNMYSLAAVPGSYTIGGNLSQLRVSRMAMAMPGAYTISGNAATLARGTAPRALPAVSGAYAITGRAANLRVARRMTAVRGTYALTGSPTGAPASGTVPQAYAATIMRYTTLNLTADLGPDTINRTLGFP